MAVALVLELQPPTASGDVAASTQASSTRRSDFNGPFRTA